MYIWIGEGVLLTVVDEAEEIGINTFYLGKLPHCINGESSPFISFPL